MELLDCIIEIEDEDNGGATSGTWTHFFEENLRTFFQTALLLVADPRGAEKNLREVIEHLDVSRPPGAEEMINVQTALAVRSISLAGGHPTSLAETREAACLLQPRLRPILELPPALRKCYVLRCLLGYAVSSCALLLGIGESEVRVLLQNAILQLQRIVDGSSSNLAGL